VEKRGNRSSGSFSSLKPVLRRRSPYPSRIAFDRQRVIFPAFHGSIIFRGFHPKKDETKTLVPITTLIKE
jgi:hypothetical protein